ncbi:MAG: T9SS type A sorting domain-containing protein [Bacteroidota bacterium]|jgi:hypothetical protein
MESAFAQYTPAAWPATFVDYTDSTGNYIQDISDQNPTYTDIIYSATTPSSVLVAYDGSTAFFRIQLAANPWRSNGSWAPYAWVVAVSGPTGQGAPIGYVSVSASGNSLDVEVKDLGTTDLIYTYAKTNASPDAVRSVPAGMSGYFYLDFQVPMAAMSARIGINSSTTLRFFYGSSASGGTINKDFMTGSAVSFLGLATTNFSGIQHGSLTPNPVELTTFSAYAKNGVAMLKWRTATELNNYGFEVERSIGDRQWMHIGFVIGGGTVNSPRTYSFEDAAMPKAERLLYRLRQVDRDGKFEYSPVVEVVLNAIAPNGITGMFPSPANGATTLNYQLDADGAMRLTLHDLSGRLLRVLAEAFDAGTGLHSTVVDVNGLSHGLYMLRLEQAGDVHMYPMLVQR